MPLIFSLAKKPAKAAIRAYYRARNALPIWLALNSKAVNLHKKYRPKLDNISERIASDLKKNGIAIAHIGELFPGQDILAKLASEARGLEKNAGVKTNKEFLRFYFDDYPLLDLKNSFVRLALENKILGIVNSYMGMFSKFNYFTLNKTMPQGEESKAVQSMRWHRDPEDKKMVKIFMYLNDVDDQSGPFVYIPETHYEGKWGNLFPPQPPRGSLPPPEEVKKIIPQNAIKACAGTAGTVIFCDTRGIHRGGHAISKERIMLTLGYSSSASMWPLRYKYPENFRKILAETSFSPAQKYALDNFNRIGKKVYKY
ncbi:MAG: phytanoyl-CoA dioxygenase family protein [Patescibacteria group bacterium]